MEPDRVFIVERDDDMRTLLVELLSSEGYAVTTFDSGFDAIAASSLPGPTRPRLLFFGSLRLFSVDVQALCKAAPGIAIVVATGAESACLSGVDVLKKPFSVAALFDAVAHFGV